MYKKILIGICVLTGFISVVSASAWNLPGVTIITRAQRWANESRRYSLTSKSQRDAIHQQESENWSDQLSESDYQGQMATDYLLETTPSEQTVEEYRESSSGNYLKWPESIHKNKSKIIIHHTAEDDTPLLTWWTWVVIQTLQNIYKYHALTRWRGDIWYNFIIDPYGNIYEWRAWWAWVVGAHTSRNNTPSIGIALMGNFNVNIPTDQALKSLIKLTTVLAKKYKINPKATTTYFKKSTEAPYIKSYTNYTIAWHQDAWVTSCPWTNLYALLPEIREQVNDNLATTVLVTARTAPLSKWVKPRGISLAWWYYSYSATHTFTLPIRWSGVKSCTSKDAGVTINSCAASANGLSISLTKKWTSWLKTIDVLTSSWTKTFSMNLIRQDDFAGIADKIKQSYANRKGIVSSSQTINKISSKISLADVKQLVHRPLTILLYELSMNYPRHEISCDWWCTILADGKLYTGDAPAIETNDGFIYLTLPSFENPLSVSHLEISSVNGWLVHVTNYTRKSYWGTPWNVFRWSLVRSKEPIKDLSSWEYSDRAVVMNTTSFDAYMKGIAETSDNDNIEKQRLILLLAKMYALFYINGENAHPSIPAWADYRAIDNPDMFQKYAWAWWERTSKMSSSLLADIQDKVVMYDGYVPILPYFSCSAGFTWSAKEKRWRKDTPYLQSKLDFASCLDFNGHGVWLSWKGAQYLAEKWWTLEQILQYYYPGVELVTLD